MVGSEAFCPRFRTPCRSSLPDNLIQEVLVTEKQAFDFASQINALSFRCSALSGDNVQQVFTKSVESALLLQESESESEYIGDKQFLREQGGCDKKACC